MQLPEQEVEKEQFCPTCGDRLIADVHGNLSCPHYVNCADIAKQRLKTLRKHNKLVIKGSQITGISRFLGGSIAL